MHHAARAVLWQATGKAAVRHGQVVQDFGLLAVNRDDADLKQAGRALNKMLDARQLWDYEADDPSETEARDAVADARKFLSTCAVKFQLSFPLAGGPHERIHARVHGCCAPGAQALLRAVGRGDTDAHGNAVSLDFESRGCGWTPAESI